MTTQRPAAPGLARDTVDDAVEKITRTCLYEGYLLWPYRRSALKNAKRWTFGGVFPPSCAAPLGERGALRAEVLLDTGGGDPARERLTVRLRFLQVVDREVAATDPADPAAPPRPVDRLTVDGEHHLAWQEATEREVSWRPTLAELLNGGAGHPVDLPAGAHREPVRDAAGRVAGEVTHRWQRLTGTVHARAEPAPDAGGVLRIAVRVENTTPCPAPDPADRDARDTAARHAFASTHLVLRTAGGARFVSLLDPPDPLRDAASGCVNDGVWPVLVDDRPPAMPGAPGGPRSARTVLASPVVMYDFPAVAPESPGDLFDGTEIDQLLVLSVLSLTDEERAEARACDPRAREILDRCAALGPEQLAALHGTIREIRPATRMTPARATAQAPLEDA
jgi:hypothetical protein